jgi:hypothetical protein
MSEEKRTFRSKTVVSPSTLRLEPAKTKREKSVDAINLIEEQKPIFSTELITRLAERIKKL